MYSSRLRDLVVFFACLPLTSCIVTLGSHNQVEKTGSCEVVAWSKCETMEEPIIETADGDSIEGPKATEVELDIDAAPDVGL